MGRPPTWVAIFGLAIALWGGEYLARDLWEPDEARYAYVAREMRDSGQWAVPHRSGEYYAHKPPLMFWLINAGGALTGSGINRVTTRLPSLLGAFLSLWAIAGIARRWADSDAAWKAVLVTATTYLFWNKGSMGQIDSLLCGLELWAIHQLIAYEDDRRAWRPVIAYACMGLAVLAKGPVGLLVPYGAYLAGVFAARDGHRRRYAHVAWGLPLALLPPAAWLLWVWLSHPPGGYLDELLFKQNIDRAAGELGHVRPFYFYLLHFPVEFLPWTPLWLAIRPAYRLLAERRVAMRRLLAWVGFVVLFFSLSASKRELYILPAYPAAGLLVAIAWPVATARAARLLAWGYGGFLTLVGGAALGTAIVDACLHVLPVPGIALAVPGLIALLGGLWLLRRGRDARGHGSAVFAVFAATWLATLGATGLFVYGAANRVKAPYPVAAAAELFLAPGEPIYLYRMHGEIMALYAHRPGQRYDDPHALEAALRAAGGGLVVMDARQWTNVSVAVSVNALRQPFRMGHKHLVWARVTFSD